MKDKLLLILATMPGVSLTATSSDEQILAAIEGMKTNALKTDEYKKKLETLEAKANEDKAEAVLIAAGKKIVPAQRDFFKASLMRDFEGTKKVIDAMPAVAQLTKETRTTTGSEDRSTWTYADYQEKDVKALGELADNDPDHYEKLFNAHYK